MRKNNDFFIIRTSLRNNPAKGQPLKLGSCTPYPCNIPANGSYHKKLTLRSCKNIVIFHLSGRNKKYPDPWPCTTYKNAKDLWRKVLRETSKMGRNKAITSPQSPQEARRDLRNTTTQASEKDSGRVFIFYLGC
jgi:hypothetical protein